MTAMLICPKSSRIIAWTVISVCLATACAIMLSRIRAYEREGTLLDIQTEIDAAEGARRRYHAAVDALREGARRAGVQTQQAVVTMVRTLEQKRDEALLQELEARVASFDASEIEILTNFTSFVQATNAMMRLFRAGGIETHVRSRAGLFRAGIETQVRSRAGHGQGAPQSFYLLVHKFDASKAREAMPGVLAEIRETNAEK